MDSKIIADVPNKRQQMMVFACLYCILAPYDNEQQDMMLKLDKMKQLDESPICKELLRLFMCKELIDFAAMENLYGKELLGFEIFNQSKAHGKKCWTELKNRVIEHVSLCECFFHNTESGSKGILSLFLYLEHPRHFQLLHPHQFESFVRITKTAS